MVAATTVIPFVAERRMKGQDLEGIANGECFDKAKTDELWKQVNSQFKDLYCKVHNLK